MHKKFVENVRKSYHSIKIFYGNTQIKKQCVINKTKNSKSLKYHMHRGNYFVKKRRLKVP